MFESENSIELIENLKIKSRIMNRLASKPSDSVFGCKPLTGQLIGCRQIPTGQTLKPLTPTNNSCSRYVLNGNTNFCSLRIEDPKKVEDTHDKDVKLMLTNIPEISRHLVVCGKLGEGTFSKVFRAKHLHNSSKEYALKYVIPTIRPSRIASELRYLRDLGGSKNIIELQTCFFSKGHTVLVMPIFPHQKFTDYVSQLSCDEVRHYMKNLLISLERVHSFHVIHRDIKPANFLYDRKTRRYALVDFGLAQNQRELLVRTYTTGAFRKIHSTKEHLNDNKFKIPENTTNNCKQLLLSSSTTKKTALNDCTTAAANNMAINNNSLIKSETKWQIRKRSRNEAQLVERSKVAPKRPRMDESSVFHSPLTPTVFKSPGNTTTAAATTTIADTLTTPVKCGGLSVIPETPPKTLQKNLINEFNGHMNISDTNNNEAMIPNEVNETPKSRFKKVPKKCRTLANKTAADLKCDCMGADQVCSVCKSKPELVAPRAGTPGFRAPEVLLKYLLQTTLIDVWSAGVIMASLLTGRYPFFRNTDDMTSLAEIVTVFGSKRVLKTAKDLDKTLLISVNYQPMDLKELCERLRGKTSTFKAPDSAYDLLDKLLDPNPRSRWSASKALTHPFFTEDIDHSSHSNN
ncbi:cell division cycle 7-related protein kinase-like [Oppia nitens]|uniref:cell division cycle 7-related protein kinase-like n=1 Tax=Oppia nitens TaxID=1686743 RepID=UPI0023DBF012|nr:cell division cycle 7-related protein kinase-like [Oppia nitens]